MREAMKLRGRSNGEGNKGEKCATAKATNHRGCHDTTVTEATEYVRLSQHLYKGGLALLPWSAPSTREFSARGEGRKDAFFRPHSASAGNKLAPASPGRPAHSMKYTFRCEHAHHVFYLFFSREWLSVIGNMMINIKLR